MLYLCIEFHKKCIRKSISIHSVLNLPTYDIPLTNTTTSKTYVKYYYNPMIPLTPHTNKKVFSAPNQTSPGTHSASYALGTGSFLGLKRPGHGINHPATPSAEVKEVVYLYPCSPSVPSWQVTLCIRLLFAPLFKPLSKIYVYFF